ncbi:MAG: hypothetical protein GXP10_08800 [Gammaproteobacteria bacterium]|nr:hypothetical protein [Gammaproteobacteria bacterium]
MKTTWMSAILLLLIAAPLQADEPPATLPKEFLAQLPLLMSLSDQEFEGLLAASSSAAELAPAKGDEETNDED